MSNSPMVDLVNKLLNNHKKVILKKISNNEIKEAMEDIRTQDRMRLTRDISKAVARVLDDYIIEYQPKDKNARLQ